MSILKAPSNTPVWVDYARCKACDICVSECPSGTLAMSYDKKSINGKIIEIVNPNFCIGCNNCELSCPDFAIHVASKEEFKFAKISPEAKAMAARIKENNFMRV